MKPLRRYAATRKSRGDGDAIENRQRTVRVDMHALEVFALRVKRELGLKPACMAIRLVSDAEMTRWNEAYRRKKGTTDVLSFPAEERRKPRDLRQQLKKVRDAQLGDIAISPMVARRNAKLFDRTLTEEIQILILHGILHLLGYDHETDRGEMQRVEMRLRRRLGIA